MKNKKWFLVIGVFLVVVVIASFLPIMPGSREVYDPEHCGTDPNCSECDVCYPYRIKNGINFWRYIGL